VSPTRIEGGNWIGQAQDRALVKAADSEPTSLEGKAEVEKKPKQASSKKQKEWKEHHCIWVTPEYKVNEHGEPVVDEHGERVWRTRLYDTRSGEDKPLPGLDTASWVKWILERADLPVEAQPIPAETELGAEPTPTHRTERDSPAYFQYLGKRGLTVMGPKTRKVYRFDSPGAVVAVDPKDRRALSAVSALRQVRKPTNVAKEL
jgi:hypothetical protein